MKRGDIYWVNLGGEKIGDWGVGAFPGEKESRRDAGDPGVRKMSDEGRLKAQRAVLYGVRHVCPNSTVLYGVRHVCPNST